AGKPLVHGVGFAGVAKLGRHQRHVLVTIVGVVETCSGLVRIHDADLDHGGLPFDTSRLTSGFGQTLRQVFQPCNTRNAFLINSGADRASPSWRPRYDAILSHPRPRLSSHMLAPSARPVRLPPCHAARASAAQWCEPAFPTSCRSPRNLLDRSRGDGFPDRAPGSHQPLTWRSG